MRMCSSGHYAPRAPEYPRYVAKTVRGCMTEFPGSQSGSILNSAFPLVFDALLVSMFLSDKGYIGYDDDENDSSSGKWYGLSWSCIHRDIPYFWGPYARQMRWKFWYAVWRWIVTFGRERSFPNFGLVFLAMFNPIPDTAFANAAQRLIDDGCLQHVEEDGVHMYYPLPGIGLRVEHVIAERN